MNDIFYGQVVDIKGQTHKVTIYDREDSGSSDAEIITLRSPGYTIDFNANIGNVIKGGFIQSECVLYTKNENANLSAFRKTLQNSKDSRYLIDIQVDDKTKWRGILLPDFSAFKDENNEDLTFTATDGLGLLKDVDYVGNTSLLLYVTNALKSIPTAELYSTGDNFLHIKTDWYDTNVVAGYEPFHMYREKNNEIWIEKNEITLYNGKTRTDIVKQSYYQVLEVILNNFNCFLIQQNGKWYLTQRRLFKLGTSITYKCYTKNGALCATTTSTETTWVNITEDNLHRAGVTFEHLIGLEKVKVNYLTKNARSLLPKDVDYDTQYTTRELQTGTGNRLLITIDIKDRGAYYADLVINVRPYWELKIIVNGTHSLKGDNIQGYNNGGGWISGTAGIYTLYGGARELDGRGWYDLFFNKIIATPELPANGEVTIEIEEAQTTINQPNLTISSELGNLDVEYIVNDEVIPNYIKFEAENNTVDFTKEIQLKDSILGSSAQSGGLIQVYDGADWIDSSGWGITGESNVQELNELLVNEILSGHKRTLLVMNGNIHVRDSSFHLPITVLKFTYDSVIHFFQINNVIYNAQNNSYSGSWVELISDSIRNAQLTKFSERTDTDVLPLYNMLATIMDFKTGKIIIGKEESQFYRTSVITPASADTWESIEWESESSINTDFFTLNSDGDEIEIPEDCEVKITGSVSFHWNSSSAESAVESFVRLLYAGSEVKPFQKTKIATHQIDDFFFIDFEGSLEVTAGNIFKLQIRVSNTDLEVVGNSVFSSAPAAYIKLEVQSK